uniref:Inosine/uridine-preferring nucleoside hydrolase domain-containing protein n=1 Tax=Hemiselmis andersenii TaxID=464988 RepID=A0A7S1DFY2_HEMAN|mmetsp:Transcript_11757/g.28534  ORF Transcript_11757/g.28534 Transcript_11757/m.28534 type:complete len:318 (+) Transcript_11757:371-1324(+)
MWKECCQLTCPRRSLVPQRKMLDLSAKSGTTEAMSLAKVEVSECGSTGVHPFPMPWRRAAYIMCHLPQLLRDGPARATLSSKKGSSAMADAIAALPEQGKVTILETGPLTCVAEMLRECGPAVRERIARIVWMGGAVDVEGNVNMKDKDPDGVFAPKTYHSAEWNVYWDAPAAREVLISGVPLVLCPLDVTNSVPITTDFLTRLAIASEGTLWGELVTQMYATTMRGIGFWHAGYYAWDVLTASYVLWEDMFETEQVALVVEVDGGAEGRTRRCERGEGTVATVLKKVEAAEWEARILAAFCGGGFDERKRKREEGK